ncbi:C1 family peptidase, partial [Capnocytophaga canis]|uniref:C1 family peptidase n=1 Tax=Capnocytophaga canis TaxID=1848903 RepID=UPI0012E0683E
MKKYVIKLRVVAIFLVTVMTLFAVSCIKEDAKEKEEVTYVLFEKNKYKGTYISNDFSLIERWRSAGGGNVNLPTSVNLDVPVGRDQGNVGSCVSFAVTSQASFYLKQMLGGVYNENLLLSPSYLHSIIRWRPGGGFCPSDTEEQFCGSFFNDAYVEIRNNGCVLLKDKPYSRNEALTAPTAAQRAEAQNRKIGSYWKIRVSDLRTVLATNNPVVAGIKLSNGTGSFRAPQSHGDSDFIWLNNNGMRSDDEDNHAVVISGYRQINGELHYQIVNSWGETGYRYVTERILTEALIRDFNDPALFVIDNIVVNNNSNNNSNNNNSGQKTEAKISLSGNLNFGTVKPNEQVSKTLIVRNIGDASLNV